MTVVAVGDTPAGVIAALAQKPGRLLIVRRCPELAALLAACQNGLAQAAVVAAGADELSATLVDRLAAVGVLVVAVAATPAQAQRLRGLGAAPVTEQVTAEQLGQVVAAAVASRRRLDAAGYAVPGVGVVPDSSPSPDSHDAASPIPAASGGPRRRADPDAAQREAADPDAAHREAAVDQPGEKAPDPPHGQDVESGTTGSDPAASESGREAAPGPGQDPEGAASDGSAHGYQAPAVAEPAGLWGRARRRFRHESWAVAPAGQSGTPSVQRPRTGGDQQSPKAAREAGGGSTLVAVWGPIGSPGRTTVAINLAAEQAAAGRSVLVIDADSYGASIAAALGLLEESASFAQACRAADQGSLSAAQFASIATKVVFSGGTFSLLTGLTRPDRWPELRAAAVARVLDRARAHAQLVVVDCGFSLENDEELSYDTVAPRRNGATLAVLAQADIILAVGAGDAVGIPRLVRGMDELRQAFPAARVEVVVNKVRRKAAGRAPEKALAQAWERFGPAGPIAHFLPWDPELTDRALLEGRLLLEIAPDAPLRRGIRGIDCAAVQQNTESAVPRATARLQNQG